jgi:predicted permease
MFARLRSIFTNSAERLDEELQNHLEMLAADYQRRGLTPEAARQGARRDLGGLTQIRETHREQRRLPLFDSVAQDVRYAFRQLRASPLFSTAAILTLALGIGANTAIYRVLDAVVFRELPVRSPRQLVMVELLRDGKPQPHLSYPFFRELAARQQALDGIFTVSSFPLHDAVLRGQGPIKMVSGVLASGDYFRVLGVGARMGRVFTIEDERESSPVAVISDRFWQDGFARSPQALGKTLIINRTAVTIIGVAPPGFFGETLGKYPDLWLPMSLQPQVMATDWLDAPYASWLTVMGRLRPGMSVRQSEPALDSLYRQLQGLTVRTFGHYQVHLEPVSHGIDELNGLARPLWLLMGIVGFVLLIACCNLANLLLGRATARAHEIGVRLALGAGRARLVRQLFTESFLLAVLGSALAMAVAWRASQALLVLAGTGQQVALDFGWRATLFTTAVAVAATILFGLAPALTATRVDVHAALQGSRRGQSGSGSRHLVGRALVMAQISISLLLLSGAGLLLRSLWNLRHQDYGFQREHVLTVNLPLEFNKTMMARNQRIRQPLYDKLNQLPGVRVAAMSAFGPMSPIQHTGNVSLPDRPSQESDYARFVSVTPGYFESMGIPIVAGRGITPGDREGSDKAVVLSQTAARILFGRANAIDRIVTLGKNFDAGKTVRVVGVAHDVKFTPRDPYGFMVYEPFAQSPAPATEAIVRATGDPARLTNAVRSAIRAVDSDVAIGKISTLDELVDEGLAHDRTIALLTACFGVVALTLTCIGVYGVIAYAVKRRTQEIGIRLALGAGTRDVAGMLAKDMAMPVLASLAIGAAAAVAAAPALRSQLFGIAPHDYSTLAGAEIFLALVAGLAAWLPARRAAALDPMEALREE